MEKVTLDLTGEIYTCYVVVNIGYESKFIVNPYNLSVDLPLLDNSTTYIVLVRY